MPCECELTFVLSVVFYVARSVHKFHFGLFTNQHTMDSDKWKEGEHHS